MFWALGFGRRNRAAVEQRPRVMSPLTCEDRRSNQVPNSGFSSALPDWEDLGSREAEGSRTAYFPA
jgi:hypothetical protein